MRDNLPAMLRDAAKKWREKHKIVGVGEMRYDFALNEAADAIEELATNYDAATDIMKHQTEYIEELNKPRWIPVTERLPDISHSVLVAGKMKYEWEKEYTRFVDLGWNDGVSFETCNDWYEGQHEFEVTHWMPLPEPPKEET